MAGGLHKLSLMEWVVERLGRATNLPYLR